MLFATWLAQQTQPAHPGPHAHNLGLTFDDEALPCGCTVRDPDRLRCYCEQRHLQTRLEWLRRRDDLLPNLGQEPIAAKWKCTCEGTHETRPGMRHIIVHPDGGVFHWSCGKPIGRITAPAGPTPCVGG